MPQVQPAPRPARDQGLVPVAPTTFTDAGELDLDSQKRGLDFMIDAGSNGLCLLANFSERFLLSDDERELLTPKLRELIRLGGAAVEGPWDGEEAVTLLPDLDAGATGSMTGGGFPDGLRPILDDYRAGWREAAIAGDTRWLPLINIENRQCGFLAAKALMKEGGINACDAPRHPWPALHPDTRAIPIEAARRLNVPALRRDH